MKRRNACEPKLVEVRSYIQTLYKHGSGGSGTNRSGEGTGEAQQEM